jgi:hypothetical protein
MPSGSSEGRNDSMRGSGISCTRTGTGSGTGSEGPGSMAVISAIGTSMPDGGRDDAGAELERERPRALFKLEDR